MPVLSQWAREWGGHIGQDGGHACAHQYAFCVTSTESCCWMSNLIATKIDMKSSIWYHPLMSSPSSLMASWIVLTPFSLEGHNLSLSGLIHIPINGFNFSAHRASASWVQGLTECLALHHVASDQGPHQSSIYCIPYQLLNGQDVAWPLTGAAQTHARRWLAGSGHVCSAASGRTLGPETRKMGERVTALTVILSDQREGLLFSISISFGSVLPEVLVLWWESGLG